MDGFFHISIGNVLEIIVLVFALIGGYYGLKNIISLLSLRMDAVEKEIAKLGTVLVQMGRYEERFLRIEDDIWDVKHGKGFVEQVSRRRARTVAGRFSGQSEPPEDDPT
jgi:hypothetical protein